MPLDHGAQCHPLVAEQASGELGVEQPGRAQAQLGQAGEILIGRVQDPLRVGENLADRAQVGQADRVDEHRAGAGAAQLDEVRALAVPVTGCPLGVDRDGAVAAGEVRYRVGELGG